MLNYTKASREDSPVISDLCRDTPEGTQAFSFLAVSPSEISEAFFCGRDENGDIRTVIFDTGDEYIMAYGKDEVPFMTFSPRYVMICEESLPRDFSVQRLEGKDILEVYKLISGGERLSFDDEKRYVLRLRSVNASYGAVFGIFFGNELVSCASVCAMNEKYALISDVFTREDKRNEGMGRKCVAACVNFALEKGRIPFLRCEEKLCSFYEKAGFVYYGKM